MPNAKLEVGDTVYLSSGGPKMTIKSIDGEIVSCQWFTKELLKEANFALASLTKTEAGTTINIEPKAAKL